MATASEILNKKEEPKRARDVLSTAETYKAHADFTRYKIDSGSELSFDEYVTQIWKPGKK